VAVGAPKARAEQPLNVPLHARILGGKVMFGAHEVMFGTWASTIVTVKVHELVLPWISVATAVTVCGEPATENEVPDGGVYTTFSTPQLSLAVAEYVTTLLHNPVVLGKVMFEGHVIPGISLSSTVTYWSYQLVLPEASTAVHVIVVVPTG
jgi:hypothetical protein